MVKLRSVDRIINMNQDDLQRKKISIDRFLQNVVGCKHENLEKSAASAPIVSKDEIGNYFCLCVLFFLIMTEFCYSCRN